LKYFKRYLSEKDILKTNDLYAVDKDIIVKLLGQYKNVLSYLDYSTVFSIYFS